MRRLLLFSLLASSLLLVGCTERETFSIGSDCGLTSDCSEPFVCRFGRCRTECLEAVDCGYGLACLFDPEVSATSGGCQLDEENRCSQNSDCSAELVCRFSTCTTACVDSRDCAADSVCVASGSGTACIAPNEGCIYTSECEAPLVCSADRLCQLECREHKDCEAPLSCDPLSFRCVL